MRTKYRFLYIAFLISGFSAILYELIWIRLLSLGLGGVTLITALVSGVFLGGLALGSLVGAKFIDRHFNKGFINLPWFYVGIEVAICIFGFLNWAIFTQVIYTAGWWKFFIAFIFLALHCVILGVTWPAMFKLLVGFGESPKVAGLIAFLNTFGGGLGALMYSFLLIANIGILGTIFVAVSGNILASIIIVFIKLTSRKVIAINPRVEEQVSKTQALNLSRSSTFWIIVLLFIGGFVGMALEIFWMRAFGLIFGSSIYSFSIVLFVVLLGLAIGGLMVRIFRLEKITVSFLGWIIFLESIFVFLGMMLLPGIPYSLVNWQLGSGELFLKDQGVKLFLSFPVIFMPSLLSGMLLPLAVILFKTHFANAGKISGLAYSINTLGAVLGGVLAAIFLLPSFGLQTGLIILAGALGGVAGLLFIYKSKYKIACLMFILIAVFGYFAYSKWNSKDIASGAFLYGKDVLGGVSGSKQLSYKDGREATISTTWHEGTTTLRINGKADASDRSDMDTQVVLGHVPILLHSDPKKVLVIGLGSGVTAGAISVHKKVEEIIVLEIEPEVAKVAKKFFSQENYNVVDNPKLELIINDARTYLLESQNRFDVITSEPSNPWTSGEANLFTREFFELGKSRLNEDGVFFQWLHLYNLRPSEVKSIIKTFSSVFPHMQLWVSPDPVDIFLAGKNEPFQLFWNRFQESLSNGKVKDSLQRRNFADEVRLFSLLWSSRNNTAPLVEDGEINTDQNPILEFRAPFGLYENTLEPNLELLASFFQEDETLFPIEGIPELERQKWHNARKVRKLVVEATSTFYKGDLNKAISLTEQAYDIDPEAPAVKRYLSKLYTRFADILINLKNKDPKRDPINFYEQAIKLNPQYYLAYKGLIPAYISVQKKQEASELITKGKEIFPWSGSLIMFQALTAGMNGDYQGAEKLLDRAKELEPHNVLIYNNLAHLYYTSNRKELAIEQWKASLQLNPDQPRIREQLRLTKGLYKLR